MRRVLFPYTAGSKVFICRANVHFGRPGSLLAEAERPSASVQCVRDQGNRPASLDELAALEGTDAESVERELELRALAVAADLALDAGEVA